MEYLGLEGTFKGHQVQPSCHDQGHLQPHQLLRALSKLNLKVSRDGAATTSSLFLHCSQLTVVHIIEPLACFRHQTFFPT